MAERLAKFSGFPVIVRPLEDYPLQLRNPRYEGYSTRDNTRNRSNANAVPSGSTQRVSSAGSDAPCDGGVHVQGDNGSAAERRPEGNRDPHEEDPGRPLARPPPLTAQDAAPTEIVHKTDVTLRFLKISQDHGNFIQVITAAKKPRRPPFGIERVSEPFIHAHVHLEFRSDEDTMVDNAYGSVGFLAKRPWCLETGYLDKDPGQARPEESLNSLPSLETSEIWGVDRLRMNCDWANETSGYCGLNTRITQRETNKLLASRIQVNYGLSVEVDTLDRTVSMLEIVIPNDGSVQQIPDVLFIYRHQMHCWVKSDSRPGIKGIMVFATHIVPDMFTKKPLKISQRCEVDLLNPNSRQTNGSKSSTASMWRTAKDFTLRVAKIPGVKQGLSLCRRIFPSRNWKTKNEQAKVLPIYARRPIGWDHTRERWCYPLWPKLDSKPQDLPPGSKARWFLKWGDEDGADCTSSETSSTAGGYSWRR
ncbi:unnamed protein product [Cyclocybe aegerita]|uniref:Uncharacterized protein n=1 Tax=Cyclocybe aegerita TaxID=1973307 RepID=A0A8S0XL69_CYCAE|nr:unnamed protein product [Cyclocybe aegerita]